MSLDFLHQYPIIFAVLWLAIGFTFAVIERTFFQSTKNIPALIWVTCWFVVLIFVAVEFIVLFAAYLCNLIDNLADRCARLCTQLFKKERR